jgi:anti-sigma factor RsiW
MDIGPHVTDQLSPYMDDELSEPERSAVAAHLRACPSCGRHLQELRAVDVAARELPLAVPDGYFDAFRATLRKRLERSRPAPRPIAPAWTLAAAAALVLAVLAPRLLREPRVAAPPAVPAPAPARPAPPFSPPLPEAEQAEPAAPAAKTPAPRGEAQDRLADQGGRLAKRDQPPARAPATTPPAAPSAPQANEVQAPGYAAAPAEADSGAPPPPAQVKAEPEAARDFEGRPAGEQKERRDKKAGTLAATGERAARSAPGAGGFDLLLRRRVSSAEEARTLRDAWLAYAQEEEAGIRADEARVRAIEAGAEAWRRGRDDSDRERAERDGREYLARADARQRDRVRAVLRSLSP